MKTLLKLAPLAILLAAAISAPSSFAGTARPITLKFHYDRAAPAEVTLAHLRHEAMDLCSVSAGRTLTLPVERACADDIVGKVVRRIGNARLAELSGHALGQAALGATISGS